MVTNNRQFITQQFMSSSPGIQQMSSRASSNPRNEPTVAIAHIAAIMKFSQQG
jgi:hypothetical protein